MDILAAKFLRFRSLPNSFYTGYLLHLSDCRIYSDATTLDNLENIDEISQFDRSRRLAETSRS